MPSTRTGVSRRRGPSAARRRRRFWRCRLPPARWGRKSRRRAASSKQRVEAPPSALSPYGVLAILAWIVMGIGAGCLGLAFARLARIAPATGGPYAFTRMAYGDFAGFLVGWGYWISIWASLPAIAAAFTGSLLALVPAARGSRPISVAITVGAMWLVVVANLRGVKTAGAIASITTYAKLVPFGAIAVLGLFYVDGEFF